MSKFDNIRKYLAEKGIKATTQRLIIYQAILELHNHPTAEEIYNKLIEKYPSVSLSTVYNTLELFVRNDIIKTVKTDNGIIRYDAILEPHHHLYCTNTNKIGDYYNEELNQLLKDFFEKHKIENFSIKELKLQIIGNFKN